MSVVCPCCYCLAQQAICRPHRGRHRLPETVTQLLWTPWCRRPCQCMVAVTVTALEARATSIAVSASVMSYLVVPPPVGPATTVAHVLAAAAVAARLSLLGVCVRVLVMVSGRWTVVPMTQTATSVTTVTWQWLRQDRRYDGRP